MIEKPTLDLEKALWEQGFFYIAGIDEAGRGAWAGPVMAGAVILPIDLDLLNIMDGVRDSKQMTPLERDRMAAIIMDQALCWSVGSADHQEIDQFGILPATRLAMERAIMDLSVKPQYLLLDYVWLPRQMTPQQSMPKGDIHSLSIASASILAKVFRDRWMTTEASEKYPVYGFDQHKGYGTQLHQSRLEEFGPCEIHRKTFHPILKDLTLF